MKVIQYEFDIIKRRCDYNLSIEGFLNDEKTKEKLNVNKTWKQCSNLSYPISNSLFFYKEYLSKTKNKIKVWVMSGDTDIILSTLGTKRWINSLNSTIKSDWEPYLDDGKPNFRLQNFL